MSTTSTPIRGDLYYLGNGMFGYVVNVIVTYHKGIKDPGLMLRVINTTTKSSKIVTRDLLFFKLVNATFIKNEPAYDWIALLNGKDTAVLAAAGTTASPTPSASQPRPRPGARLGARPSPRTGKVLVPVKMNVPVKPKGVPNPVVPTPWMQKFVTPEPPAKAKPVHKNECECGSFKVGITSRGYGHSTWCPMHKEKKGS